MKIKVVFKDNRECLFDANSFMLGDKGFYDLIFVDEKDDEKCVACVSISEIKYLMFKDGVLVVEDTKGFRTNLYKLKKKMFLFKYGKGIVFIES